MAKRNLYEVERGYEDASIPKEKLTFGVVAKCDRLNVRKKPHRTSEVLEIIEEDAPVTITMSKSTQNWYYVKTESGTEGYCMTDYIVRKK